MNRELLTEGKVIYKKSLKNGRANKNGGKSSKRISNNHQSIPQQKSTDIRGIIEYLEEEREKIREQEDISENFKRKLEKKLKRNIKKALGILFSDYRQTSII